MASISNNGWSHEFTLSFIDLYKSQESVWKVKSKDYNDRLKKDRAYETLVAKMREIDPDANRDKVIKKINNLRSSFRKELKRMRQSQKSGCGVEDGYKPKLWYFGNLSFLLDQEETTKPRSYTEEDDQEEESSDTEIEDAPVGDCPRKRPRRRLHESDTILKIVGAILQNVCKEDTLDSFGKIVAFKLRSMPKEQRVHAEKLINEVLYEAELGNLSRNFTFRPLVPKNHN